MKKATFDQTTRHPVRVIENQSGNRFRALVCAGMTTLMLLAATDSKAVIFFPSTSDLSRVSFDEDSNFGATGTLNSITADGNGFDYNVTFGTTGANEGVNVAANFANPLLDLSRFTDIEVNTEVLDGTATVVLFLQDDAPNFTFVQGNGPNGQNLASGVLPLDYQFQPPFAANDIRFYGFAFFGVAGTSATIEITPAPEPSSLALLTLGLSGGWVMIRRQKARAMN